VLHVVHFYCWTSVQVHWDSVCCHVCFLHCSFIVNITIFMPGVPAGPLKLLFEMIWTKYKYSMKFPHTFLAASSSLTCYVTTASWSKLRH
jgi:hypothetical protein